MTPLLGIETATDALSVAVAIDQVVDGEYSLRKKNIHDALLLSLTKQVLHDLEMDVRDLRGVAVSSGPGSFTGLRIGMSFAKGLVYGRNIPLICVPTFDALAFQIASSHLLSGKTTLVVTFDARREDVYVAQYRLSENDFHCTHPVKAAHVSEAVTELSSGMWLVGSGAYKLGKAMNGACKMIEGELAECHAGSVALFGARMLSEGKVADVASCEPNYVKEFFTAASGN